MTFEDLLRDIRAKKFVPVYFLHGEEPYFIDRIEAEVEKHALSEAERGFNQTVLYGKDVDPLSLLDNLRRYPMMSERQTVILREAQDMKGIGDLLPYIEKPMPTTVFVVCYKHKKYDMNTKLGKALKAKALVYESKRLYDNQLPDWMTAYAKSQHLALQPEAALLLAEYLGADLGRASNEIDKLALNLSAGALVTTSHVQEYVGISKDYNVYELQKALALKDAAKIARIQQYFAANIRRNPLITIISSLYSYFSKVFMLFYLQGKSEAEIAKTLELRSEWFLKDYKLALQHYSLAQVTAVLHILKEYDLKSKGLNVNSVDEEALMKELFFKILHVSFL